MRSRPISIASADVRLSELMTVSGRSEPAVSEAAVPQEGVWGTPQQQPADVVISILEGYASRGVFAGFRLSKRQARKVDFTILWHFRRVFSIHFDEAKASLTLTGLLPRVSAAPHLRREFGAYLRHCASPERQAHRRTDPEKALVTCYVRNDSLSLRVEVRDGDYEYATRRLVHLVNEVFLDFLRDARYVEYMVEHLGMNPETGNSL